MWVRTVAASLVLLVSVVACGTPHEYTVDPSQRLPAWQRQGVPNAAPSRQPLAVVRFYTLGEHCPDCKRLIALMLDPSQDVAVRGISLDEHYGGRVRFEVADARSPDGVAASERYGFGDLRHGVVGLSPTGHTVFLLPGSHHDRETMVATIDGVLR